MLEKLSMCPKQSKRFPTLLYLKPLMWSTKELWRTFNLSQTPSAFQKSQRKVSTWIGKAAFAKADTKAEDKERTIRKEDLASGVHNFFAPQDNQDSVSDSASGPTVDSETPRYNPRPLGNVHHRAVALLNAITTGDDPSLKEALASPEWFKWLATICQELESLTFNETWKIAKPRPPALRTAFAIRDHLATQKRLYRTPSKIQFPSDRPRKATTRGG